MKKKGQVGELKRATTAATMMVGVRKECCVM